MDLYLRKSDDGQLGPEIYRVILKDDGDEVEIGSISLQHWQSITSSPCGRTRRKAAAPTGPTACGNSSLPGAVRG
jgi:hypothetical protein